MISQEVYDIAVAVAESSDLAKQLTRNISPLQKALENLAKQRIPNLNNLGNAWFQMDDSVLQSIQRFLASAGAFRDARVPEFDMHRQVVKTGRLAGMSRQDLEDSVLGYSVGTLLRDTEHTPCWPLTGGLVEQYNDAVKGVQIRDMQFEETRKWSIEQVSSAFGIAGDSFLNLDIERAVNQEMVRAVSDSIDKMIMYGHPNPITAIQARQEVYDRPAEAALQAVRPKQFVGWDRAIPEADHTSYVSVRLGNGAQLFETCVYFELNVDYSNGIQVIDGEVRMEYAAAQRILRATDDYPRGYRMYRERRPVHFHLVARDTEVSFDGYITNLIEERPHLLDLPVYVCDDILSPRITTYRGEPDMARLGFTAIGSGNMVVRDRYSAPSLTLSAFSGITHEMYYPRQTKDQWVDENALASIFGGRVEDEEDQGDDYFLFDE